MSEPRFNKITLILGARGTGKTTYLIGDKKKGVIGLLEKVYTNRGMKILVICTTDHPHYRHVSLLEKKDFVKFKKGIARIIINPEDINNFCRFLTDSNNLWNTIIIWEEAKDHSETKICKELGRMIRNTKQQNVDMFFMYHSFGETPTDIYRKIDYISLFKTLDHWECRKTFMGSYISRIDKAYKEVQASNNNYINKTVRTIDAIR
ncbi:MAG: DEAD/DEAH box helicase family protein [Bacteroidetes bacterium]|nr:DEAD/DEAH box helicase family protein [Bacteroidota bacterium]